MDAVTIDAILARGVDVARSDTATVSAEALADVRHGHIFAQQGDLYFARLDSVPRDVVPWPFDHGQLAPGSTQGSRHTVDTQRVRLWLLAHPTPLDGPIIEAPKGVEVCHPEHGHHVYPPGVYKVTYQRAYATELRRVVD